MFVTFGLLQVKLGLWWPHVCPLHLPYRDHALTLRFLLPGKVISHNTHYEVQTVRIPAVSEN